MVLFAHQPSSPTPVRQRGSWGHKSEGVGEVCRQDGGAPWTFLPGNPLGHSLGVREAGHPYRGWEACVDAVQKRSTLSQNYCGNVRVGG